MKEISIRKQRFLRAQKIGLQELYQPLTLLRIWRTNLTTNMIKMKLIIFRDV